MNLSTLKSNTMSLLLAFCLAPTLIFSQFYDGFESGAYLPTWTDGVGSYTNTVTTTNPAVGSYRFELIGGGAHFTGLETNFTASQPDFVTWRVMSPTVTNHLGYFAVGDSQTSTNFGVSLVHITASGELRFIGPSAFYYLTPVSANVWYDIELMNIDWVNKEYDIYIDGVLHYTDFPFNSPTSTEISQVQLYNFNSGTAYFDEIQLGNACTTPPTAICQNVTTYLDGAGNATILADDLDGGSLDNCGTSGLTFSASQTAFNCSDISAVPIPSEALIITGVIDGPLPGGLPKAVELYVAADIADLSQYGLGSANNGAGTDGEELTFPADSYTAGQFIYVATDSLEFNNWFGFYPNYKHGMATNINGDDAIELFHNSVVVDIFGDINMSGTGQPWDHLDGWTYRNNATGPDGSSFVLANWSFSGVNALDGETTNAGAATPFPVGTYVGASSGTTVTLTVTDGNSNFSTCDAVVNVLDTISPTASQPIAVMVQCAADVPAVDPLVFTDEADNCTGSPVVAFVSEVSSGTCPETITRTYSITDDSGNSINVDHIILVNDDTAPTASSPLPVNVECSADIPAPNPSDVTDEADNCTVAPVVTWVGDVSDNGTCPEIVTRTYSITDDCGNFITVDQTITILDVTAPVPDGGLLPVNSSCDVTLNNPTGTDNCDGAMTAVGDVTFPITAVGTTTVTWTYSDACGNQTIQTQDVIITPMDVTTTTVDLTISANNSNGTYQWIDCGNNQPISGATSQDYTATANGDYAVIITEAPCSDTSACVTIDNVGNEHLEITTLSLFPNPTTGVFAINYDGIIKEISLVDMMGRLVSVPSNLIEKSVDCSELESGKYIVQITTTDDRIIQGTIIVQK